MYITWPLIQAWSVNMVAAPSGPIGRKYPKMLAKIYPIIIKVDSF